MATPRAPTALGRASSSGQRHLPASTPSHSPSPRAPVPAGVAARPCAARGPAAHTRAAGRSGVAAAASAGSGGRLAALPRPSGGRGRGRAGPAPCRGAGVLEGAAPAAAAQCSSAAAVGESLLRRWLGLGDGDDLPVQTETAPLRDTRCDLTVCATSVSAGERRHALLAFVLTAAGDEGSRQGKRIGDLRSPVLHWGCVHGRGDRWNAPPAGWSTWPNISHDARGGAWQTPFAEQQMAGVGPALTMMLQVPCEGPLRSGGLSFLVKAGSSSWLGNGATFSDFFAPTSALPELAGDAVTAAAAKAKEEAAVAAGGGSELGLVAPEQTLDMTRLAATPCQESRGKGDWRNKGGDHGKHNHHNHHQQQHHAQEPELPNAGRRAKEPPTDETQVCTLSAAELHAAAAAQLSTWVALQQDLQLPAGGLDVQRHEFPVQGHPSTPLVAASAALWAAGEGGAGRRPVLVAAVLGDVGLTGQRSPGLVFHWSLVASEAAAVKASEPGGGAPEVSVVPDGWSTLPDLSWDAGSGFWDTPMTRRLLQGDGDGGCRQGSPALGAAAAGAPAGMYAAMMRLPLEGALCTGGLLFAARTARRQWVRHGGTGGPFFLPTGGHAQRLGLAPAAEAEAAAAAALAGPAAKALAAAGLSQEEIRAFAASVPAASEAALKLAASRPPATGDKGRAAAALSSADADLAALIDRHSAMGAGSGAEGAAPAKARRGGGEPESAGGGDAEAAGRAAVLKFAREFDPEPLDLHGAAWGLPHSHREPLDVPALDPRGDLLHRIGELEHKACRSLMHRYGIAADLVNELLPDLRTAAAAAPASLAWPPAGAGSEEGEGEAPDAAVRGRAALSGLVAVAVWLRLSSLRLLEWNRNYNVKPREISAALDRLGAALVQVYEAAPQLRGVARLALAAAGRGGEGDMGQRIRDEILAIQQRNGCKGGMMEEWHQKLHNNSSPDDLAICQALLDYLASGQQPQAYWDSLAAEGVTPERLAAYDRPIRSAPPTFPEGAVAQLAEDLRAYRRTLAAVHSGADLAAAVDGVLGYDAGECKGKRVKVEPLAAVATPRLRQLLSALLLLVQGGSGGASGSRPPSPGAGAGAGAGAGGSSSSSSSVSGKVSAMLEMEHSLKVQALAVAARRCLLGPLQAGSAACDGRLRDVLFLDMALELAGRSALESALAAVRAAAPSTLLGGLLALLQQPLASAALSSLPGQAGNHALASVCAQLQRLSSECPGLDAKAKARHALSLLERLRGLLASLSARTTALLQPTADSLARTLQVPCDDPLGPVALLAEEVVRGSAAAALSQLLTAVEPSLRRLAGVGAWSVVSRLPSSVTGTLSPVVPCLSQLDAAALEAPATILVLQRLAGEEEVPPGVVGVVVLGDCPDVLSHAAVRARNCRVPVVACPSSEEAQVARVEALAGRLVTLTISGDDVTVHEAQAAGAAAAEATTTPAGGGAGAAAAQEQEQEQEQARRRQLAAAEAEWGGTWVVGPEGFAPGLVGAKAMSASELSRAEGLPRWLRLPPSLALPHGAFEEALRWRDNADVARELQRLAAEVAAAAAERGAEGVPPHQLQELRSLVGQLRAPPALRAELEPRLASLAGEASAGAAPPAWGDAWRAVQGVWASQWNQRAVAALAKAGLPMRHLRMGVLLQPLLPARYAFVAHTVDPASGSAGRVAVQAVVGLGEVLVGNHAGRALGGTVARQALDDALLLLRGGEPAAPAPEVLLRAVDVCSYPSKDAAVVPGGAPLPCGIGGGGGGGALVLMARSDSNAEDLPGFAGAGLFDSLPTRPTRSLLLDYTQEPLVWDQREAAELLWRCALAAVAAERALGGEAAGGGAGLDVEGCVTDDGGMWLLQARPQV